MTWNEVLNDKSLQDLPYKIELNERGNIEMSPATNIHGIYQGEILHLLKLHARGRTFPECSIDTNIGVKVPDVVWASKEFMRQFGYSTPYEFAPEICVEIISPSNTTKEILEKRKAYFERGALEVWTCDLQGSMQFFDANVKLEQSVLVPTFPVLVVLEEDE
jgi:Uma2 family endonuclease